MQVELNKELMDELVKEIKGFLPKVSSCISSYATTHSKDDLYEAYRLMHTIAGDSAIVGQQALSLVARYCEEVLESVLNEEQKLTREIEIFIGQSLTNIEGYLLGMENETAQQEDLLIDSTLAYRRLKGLPEEQDEAEVMKLLKELSSSDSEDSLQEQSDTTDVTEEEDQIVYPELVDMFKQETPERLNTVSKLLPQYIKQPDNREDLQEVRRHIHTLKGEANMVGLRSIGRLAHRMEDLLDKLYDKETELSTDISHLLISSVDVLEDMLAGRGQDEDVKTRIKDIYGAYNQIIGGNYTPALPKPKTFEQTNEPQQPTAVAQSQELYVRVPLKKLDEMVRLMSEFVISRSSFQQQLGGMLREIDELERSSKRMGRVSNKLETEYEVATLSGGSFKLAPSVAKNPSGKDSWLAAEFDELEFDRYTEFHLLSRQAIEATTDIDAVSHKVKNLIGDFESSIGRLGRLTNEMQDKLMRLRMVPLSTLSTRFDRTVRVTASKCQKNATFVIKGDHVELDKSVIETIADPLMHMLRNSVDHGIEVPDLRRKFGKPEQGTVTVEAYYEGSEVIIRISDDGAGIDSENLKQNAIKKGFFTQEQLQQFKEEEIYQLIFLPGFSTATALSDVSGRGVGMDVVKTVVQKLKGNIDISSTRGQGTVFTIHIPMTLATTKAFIVEAATETFAVPFNNVTRVLLFQKDRVELVGNVPAMRIDGKTYEVVELGQAMGLNITKAPENPSMMLVKAGDKTFALVVDRLVEQREVVIKSLGNHLRYVPAIAGATLTGDGSVMLILNPSELVKDDKRQITAPARTAVKATRTLQKPLDVLVVDDSLSVRTIVSNLVKQAGWNPIQARDGLEALQQIQSTNQRPDVILLDVEMPRMDGYELTASLRAERAYQNIPIVMLTSRAGEKHRRKAIELGVNEYLVKPYNDEQLLSVIRQLVFAS